MLIYNFASPPKSTVRSTGISNCHIAQCLFHSHLQCLLPTVQGYSRTELARFIERWFSVKDCRNELKRELRLVKLKLYSIFSLTTRIGNIADIAMWVLCVRTGINVVGTDSAARKRKRCRCLAGH